MMNQKPKARFKKTLTKPVASSQVELHPQSIKQMKGGHPWITKDRFTEKFPLKNHLLVGTASGKAVCSFIHDPEHPTIKGRVWNLTPPFVLYKRQFQLEVIERLQTSMEKRVASKVHTRRDNFYLVFGEADLLPGLFVQKLGKHLIVQCYCFFWRNYQQFLLQQLEQLANNYFPGFSHHCWVQYRSQKLTPLKSMVRRPAKGTDVIQEGGIKVRLHLGEAYDFGLYTDMAALREQMYPHLQKAKRCLNLYAYSGLFSLMALKAGCDSVVSVDLSPKYLEWLEENLKLNSELPAEKHQSFCMAVEEAIPLLLSKKESFDFIVCDPPSSSSNHKNQKRSSLQHYQELLPSLLKILAPNGKLLLFHNGHAISPGRFYQQMEQIYRPHNLQVIAKLGLADDCPTLPTFSEGAYLKGLLLEKK